MKGWIVLFGEKPGLIDRVRAFGYRPFLVTCTPPSESEVDLLVVSPEYAASGAFDPELFKALPVSEVAGVLTAYDTVVELAAKFRNHFCPHLPGISVSQAEIVRDKLLMKDTMQALGIESAPYRALDVRAAWSDMTSVLGERILVKPRRRAGASGIFSIASEQEWRQWLATEPSPEEYYLEAFLSPITELCCDTLVVDSRIVAQFSGEYTVDCLRSNQQRTGFGVGFPGAVGAEADSRMKEMAARFIGGIGLRDAYCHVEFIHHEGRVYLGEMGVRLAGGLQVPVESHICGTDLFEWYIRLLVPAERALLKTRFDFSSKLYGYYLYPRRPGRIVDIKSDFNRPWILESKMHVKVGDTVEAEDLSVANVGHVIFEADSLDELRARQEEAKHLAQIEIENTSAR